ncbi:hypothetical protein B0H14DRAFT_3463669 [Mycena olivaceomarginata]|nr:hypothetical protein B0H14DRAFT_3463669 [Mycena olivaceomarginata]
MIRKEDVQIAARKDSRRRIREHQVYAKDLMEMADSYVFNEIVKKERNDTPPTGKAGRRVRQGDNLLARAGNPFMARSRGEGLRVAKDRMGRLREALRLYMRAAQRADGTMPVIGSRVWGTTHFMERRILRTARKLDTTEGIVRKHYRPAQQDTVNWGVRRTEKVEEKDLDARGLAYKTEQQLPPLHRLAPSAVERARMPLLQAFPGIGNVSGGHVLSLGHAHYASRGLLGTPPPPSSPSATPFSTAPGPESTPRTPPAALSPAGEPRPYYNYPYPPPSFADADSEIGADPPAVFAHPDPTLLRAPPWTRRGKMLRWAKYSKKNENAGASREVGERAGELKGVTGVAGQGAVKLAWVRESPPPTSQPSLAHALRLRLAGKVRVYSTRAWAGDT